MFFIYNNKNSSNDFYIKVRKVNNLSSPQIKYEKIEVSGRNGEVLIFNNKFSNFLLELECSLDARKVKNINELSREIKKWLLTDLSYKKLFLSNDIEYYYEAICCNKLDFEHIIQNYKHFIITFECKPFKKYIHGDSKIILTQSSTLYNEGLASNPYIKVIGSGDITININNQKLILKGVEDYIEVDTELYNCFKGNINQNNKMYSDFPMLEEGKNDITWEGNVTQLEILPRWVVL